MQRDIHQHINSCNLCIQFLPNKVHTQPMHLEIPQVPFPSCAMDCIGQLPTSSIGHRHMLTFNCLLISYLITVPLKKKWQMKSPWSILTKSSQKTSCPKFILQGNGTEFENEQFMSVSDSLGFKHNYFNPYYARGDSRIEDVYNFLKCTIMKFTYGSQLQWDDVLPLAMYCFNIAPSMDDLESPF